MSDDIEDDASDFFIHFHLFLEKMDRDPAFGGV